MELWLAKAYLYTFLSTKIDKISTVIWISATAVYLSVSFTFGYWNLTWIIWIVAALVQGIVSTVKKEE